MDQWKERLREHLGLGPKDIGQLGGGKKPKLTGRIDLATLQSLTRADDPAAILSEYGLVIVDDMPPCRGSHVRASDPGDTSTALARAHRHAEAHGWP